MRIPFLKPPLGDSEIDAVTRVLKTSDLSSGADVDRFEKEFAEYIGTEHAFAVNSGTSALELILEAYKYMGCLKQGDKVLIPSFTFVAVANAVVNAGLIPIFADVDKKTYNMCIMSQSPTPKGVGMSREGYGKLVDKEA